MLGIVLIGNLNKIDLGKKRKKKVGEANKHKINVPFSKNIISFNCYFNLCLLILRISSEIRLVGEKYQ